MLELNCGSIVPKPATENYNIHLNSVILVTCKHHPSSPTPLLALAWGWGVQDHSLLQHMKSLVVNPPEKKEFRRPVFSSRLYHFQVSVACHFTYQASVSSSIKCGEFLLYLFTTLYLKLLYISYLYRCSQQFCDVDQLESSPQKRNIARKGRVGLICLALRRESTSYCHATYTTVYTAWG